MAKIKRAITPSEAIASFERAFRSGNPDEVEKLLRDVLNVQVAVVDDKLEAEKKLAEGKKLKTVPVPYEVFLGKVRTILTESSRNRSIKGSDPGVYFLEANLLSPVSSTEEILPGKTYVLLSALAGYSSEEGLTFSGPGCSTGFEDQPEAERREKFTEGRFQTWQEHSQGVWERSKRIAKFYRPFIQSWAKGVLSEQWKATTKQEQATTKQEQFVESVLWAIRIATFLHDVGKLNEQWQDVIWKNEQTISGRQSRQFIARTNPVPNDEIRKQLHKPPSHAPFAYPFLSTFLRELLGDYRFLDAIALAAARHHCLEVTGALKEEFKWANGADVVLQQLLEKILGELSEDGKNTLNKALSQALQTVQGETIADEPPSPADDFYFIYCLTNRMVKICDWEDAGQTTIELPCNMEG